jgi:hypothetical protein
VPWHLSKSDPRKFYDNFHNVVAVAQTADQAALIVRAVNALPSGAPGKESAEDGRSPGGTSEHAKADVPLDTFEPDECCGKHLAKALRHLSSSLESFACPKCGTEWRPTVKGPLRHWEPQAAVMIFR